MNAYEIDWELNVPKDKAIEHLNELLCKKPYQFKIQKQMRSKFSGDDFEFAIWRSMAWGTALRKEIEARGRIGKLDSGSYFSASIKISSPYCYVNLNWKNLKYIIPIFLFSWISILVSHFTFENSTYLEIFFGAIFSVSCIILIIGFIKYVSIEDKLNETIEMFEKSFYKIRKFAS